MEQAEVQVRTRVRNPEVSERQAAMAFLRPITAEIANWQLSVAQLVGIGERCRLRGECDGAAAAEANALERVIAEGRHALNNELQRTTSGIRRHGRVQDCLKALDSVAIGASRAKYLLGLAGGPNPTSSARRPTRA